MPIENVGDAKDGAPRQFRAKAQVITARDRRSMLLTDTNGFDCHFTTEA